MRPEGETKKVPTAFWGRQAPHYAPFLRRPRRSGSADYNKEPLSVSSRRAAFCALAPISPRIVLSAIWRRRIGQLRMIGENMEGADETCASQLQKMAPLKDLSGRSRCGCRLLGCGISAFRSTRGHSDGAILLGPLGRRVRSQCPCDAVFNRVTLEVFHSEGVWEARPRCIA
jgi:hypothetical protein